MAIDKALIEENQKRLLEEKKRLEGLLARVAKRDKTTGDFHAKYPDFLGTQEDENASEVDAYETNIAEEWDLEQKFHRVEAAMKRIADGTYGICLNGGEEMPRARLAALPEAENCIEHDYQKK